LAYYLGLGIPQNYKLAYVWYSLAAAQGYPDHAAGNRDAAAGWLIPSQLADAQKLAAEIQYRIDSKVGSQEETGKQIIGSGTGFIITRDGYIVTCYHVIQDADTIEAVSGSQEYQAQVIRIDPYNDLALLKIDGAFPAMSFSSDRSSRMGQKVFTIGYPNPNLQGANAKYTEGAINSLTGFQDDIRLYQISIPVQPGNSGGALLDENGNICGVIVAMLDAKAAFEMSGSLPQNVNYAVKSSYVKAMLDTLPEISDELPLS